MTHQSEQQLENKLLAQLGDLKYERVTIEDEVGLRDNLRKQVEKLNDIYFTDEEWRKVSGFLDKGNSFEKAKTLRDKFSFEREGGKTVWIRFFSKKWQENIFQVTNQITQVGKYTNRYDVTILINGLPLVHIELKRSGIEMEEAFNQIQRYHKHSFAGTLFEYTQIFVISNGVNSKYFSNNPRQTFEQTFYWTSADNTKITKLEDFTQAFLEPSKISEMISKHIVLAESLKIPMVLRPYQYYAVKQLVKRVKETDKNGYIWHTTGSGKTLTSFKASQIISDMPLVKKILFVVDRKDLDIQTTKEFNSFSDGSVDGTENTKSLVNQLKDANTKLIVTTIQKLDIAISKEAYLKKFADLADEKVVIIFDECHRSQFGKTHKHIKNFFKKSQLFGFTGTPIFADNNVGGVITKDVFGERLHEYMITHAISDNNVLGFSVEYVGKYKQKDANTLDLDISSEQLVDGIDTKEVLESDTRLEKIADYILSDWRRKCKRGKFNAIFATSNVPVLKKYYSIFKEKKKEDFRIATIFTYQANEEADSDMLDVDLFLDKGDKIDKHSRDFLEDCIADYNKTYACNFSTDRFYDYYKDLQKRIKNKQVDLVLVVNMFLTGFDSPRLNTLYVDKNLRYHGLVQAYSRTNRLLNSDKPHGNIVSFRNLKEATDKALSLFGDANAAEIVFKKPYEEQKKEFENKLAELKLRVPTVESVDILQGEQEKAMFVKIFRDLLRIKSSLETFAEFSFDDLGISEQEFYDYQGKYLDIYSERKDREKEADSILDEIDFELELTVRDLVNFDYIIKLIAGLKDIKTKKAREKQTEEILKIFDRDIRLKKKKELIRKFIEENMPKLSKSADIEKAFEEYWNHERFKFLKNVSDSEKISVASIEKLIGEYQYTQKPPRGQEVADMVEDKLPIAKRRGVLSRIKGAIENVVEVFDW